MGHFIRAIIAPHETAAELEACWNYAVERPLPQGFGLVFLTDALFDDIEELADVPGGPLAPELAYLTEAVHQVLLQTSCQTRLVYIETDYFGGYGAQAGALYENGRLRVPPQRGDGTVNQLLHLLGVRCLSGRDEFDSLELYRYRRMPD